MRTFKGANSENRQTTMDAASAIFGPAQLAWLKAGLTNSGALWKIVAADLPLGMIVGDGPNRYEAVANAENGAPSGRELELADLLRYLKQQRIRNVVWVTADVHYCAAHEYHPTRAAFTDFDPFWEFVAGPLNAGTFGPNALDATFGPQAKFVGIPAGMKGNRPPSDGFQFFGTLTASAKTRALTVRLHNLAGEVIYTNELAPA
jgi:alkaline phosphatase D